MKKEKIFLRDEDAETLKQYCRGCHFFDASIPIEQNCTIISWYNSKEKDNMKHMIEYVKECACNQKCLVKAACREEQCLVWMKCVENIAQKRINQRCKNRLKPSHVKVVSS